MAFCYIRNKPIPVMAPDEAAEQLAPLIETLRADALPEHGHLTVGLLSLSSRSFLQSDRLPALPALVVRKRGATWGDGVGGGVPCVAQCGNGPGMC